MKDAETPEVYEVTEGTSSSSITYILFISKYWILLVRCIFNQNSRNFASSFYKQPNVILILYRRLHGQREEKRPVPKPSCKGEKRIDAVHQIA